MDATDERRRSAMNALQAAQALHPHDAPLNPARFAGHEAVESIQLSRYQRERPQNWMSRLLGRAVTLDDTVQAQFRSAREEHARLEAVCRDEDLLSTLPWLDIEAQRVPLSQWLNAVLTLVEDQARLILGHPNAQPQNMSSHVDMTSTQRRLLELLQAGAQLENWRLFCSEVDGCSEEELSPLIPRLARIVARWPAETRPIPGQWLKPPFDDPRLHLVPLSVLDLSRMKLRDADIEALATSPHLIQVSELSLEAVPLSQAPLKALLESVHLGALTRLNLAKTRLRLEGMQALAQCEALQTLTHLNLSNNSLGAEGLAPLLTAPLQALTHLHLNSVTNPQWGTAEAPAGGIRDLVQSSLCASLTHLSLEHNQLGLQDMQAIANTPHLSTLTHLFLAGNATGDAGFRALMRASQLPLLEHLDLSANSLTASGVARWGELVAMSPVKTLNLASNPIGRDGARALAKSPHVSRLRELSLAQGELDTLSAVALAQSASLAGLESLDLSDNLILDRGARMLVSSSHLTSLSVLDLSANGITDAGATALATLEGLSRLKRLKLGRNRITVQGVQALARSPHLMNLEELDLGLNPIGPGGRAILAGMAESGEVQISFGWS